MIVELARELLGMRVKMVTILVPKQKGEGRRVAGKIEKNIPKKNGVAAVVWMKHPPLTMMPVKNHQGIVVGRKRIRNRESGLVFPPRKMMIPIHWK
jgi:hypothetical protein